MAEMLSLHRMYIAWRVRAHLEVRGIFADQKVDISTLEFHLVILPKITIHFTAMALYPDVCRFSPQPTRHSDML